MCRELELVIIDVVISCDDFVGTDKEWEELVLDSILGVNIFAG